MLNKLLPVILLLVGSAIGGGAGFLLRPEAQEPVAAISDEGAEQDSKTVSEIIETDSAVNEVPIEYVKLSNQFVVPIVTDKRVSSLVVMSLSIEVPESQRDQVFRHEPKLRDSFLEVLFDHANVGGFDGAFTQTINLQNLRRALTEVGQRDIGKDVVKDVLITEIARQDY
jgi:flagellar FliL protein